MTEQDANTVLSFARLLAYSNDEDVLRILQNVTDMFLTIRGAMLTWRLFPGAIITDDNSDIQ